MNKVKLLITSLILISGMVSLVVASDPIKDHKGKDITACEVIDNLPSEELNKAERSALLLMIEEEKLARDVYITLGEKYDVNVFKHISDAENRHLEAIACLFGKYNLENPVEGKALGEFSNRKFRELYESLVIRGKTDLTEALKVGATIEDLDIYDLNELLDNSNIDNQDLKSVFKELVRGSRNHMRAFTKNLDKQNASYEVQHISKDDYKAIINGEQERGGWLCGDEKPRDSRVKSCKGEKGNCGKNCKDHSSQNHDCKGKGNQHGKH